MGRPNRMSTYENETNYFLRFDLAGLQKEDIDVEITTDRLVVAGKDRSDGFRRTYNLPKNAEGESIEGNFKDGVLHLVIPKTHLVH